MNSKKVNAKATDIRVRMFFAVITFLVGAGLLLVRYNAISGIAAAEKWTLTPCKIVQSELVSGDEGGRWLELTYKYEVNGLNYSGDRLDLFAGSMGTDSAWESKIYEEHPVGSTATCFVDPKNPATSVFDNKHGMENTANLLLLAMPFLAIGSVFTFSVLWSWSHARAIKHFQGITQDSFGPPPRKLSIIQTLGLLAVPKAALIAMAFFIGFTLVFRVLEGPAIMGDMIPRQTVEASGTLTDINETGHKQFNGRVLEFRFEFEFANRLHQGTSYRVSNQYEPGDEVRVLVFPSDLDRSRIVGFRRRSVSLLVVLVPVSILALLVLGIVGAYSTCIRLFGLIKRGEVAKARLISIEETDVVNPFTHHTFEVGDKEYNVDTRSNLAADSNNSFVFYYANNPARNVGISTELTRLLTTGVSLWEVVLFSLAPPLFCVAAVVFAWNV